MLLVPTSNPQIILSRATRKFEYQNPKYETDSIAVILRSEATKELLRRYEFLHFVQDDTPPVSVSDFVLRISDLKI
ncbi:MAG: hypothetical protein AUK17_02215 [Parcubacteria group bacterium CG2_30_44_18]|nr:MAG: hypothetical protein AUK17_02215 [Parcubacteria group bacterium CG2_30_44_18]